MFNLIKANKKDIGTMISMTKEYYGDIEISNEDFLNWQYYNNPVGDAYIRIAYNEDDPAGQYIIIPMNMKVNDDIVKCTLSLNTLTRQKYRGKKVFTLLAEKVYEDCKEDGAKFTYGFPNQNSFPGFIKKLDFKNIGYLPLLLRPINIENMIYKKTKNKLISKVSNISNIYFSIKKENFENVFEIDEKKIYIFDEFWDKIKNKYSVIGVRDSKYINWRYRQIPLREYKIFGAIKNNSLSAYVVLRETNIDEFNCGMIVDFMCVDSNDKDAHKLIEYCVNYFYKKNMDMVGCLMNSNSEEYKILKNNKFIKVPKKFEPQPFPVILRNHDTNFSISEDIKDWFLTMGDYDVI